MLQEIDPTTLYFTHSKIREKFSGCGKYLTETLQEILDGKTKVSDIPKIKVLNDGNGRLYSMNNRRLWVFKELKAKGFLDTIVVDLKVAKSKSEKRLGNSDLSLQAKLVLH
ncbi:hypothetical protein BC833DRAFT_607522 [Globomyces pollinis-pini]|nr:hypothetical protein BC833DRAFT_607522 [Globomyces pollinis-pini]